MKQRKSDISIDGPNDTRKKRKSDILWKVVIEEVFDDLLRFIFPDADQVYDLERGFEFMDKELAEMYPEPDKESKTKVADKLVKVFTREGKEEWVLCHVEIQGETKPGERLLFAERMLHYFYRIWDKNKDKSKKPVPVSAVAIFTGPDGKKMPDRFTYEYRKTRLLYEFPTISILDYMFEELEKSDNPFAQVVIRAIFVFLESYVLFKKPEMNRIFKERIQPQDKNNIMGIDEYLKQVGKEEGLAEGLEKGLEQGMEKGRENSSRLFVENLLKDGRFPIDKIASLANVTVDFVKKIKKDLKAK
jgi:hypothetical protein